MGIVRTESVAVRLRDIAIAKASCYALWVRGERLTYGELFEAARSLAMALLSAPRIRPGDRVSFLANRTKAAYISVLACLLAGMTYVPLNPRYPAARNLRILHRSGASGLILDERNASFIDHLSEAYSNPPTIISPECELPSRGNVGVVNKDEIPSGVGWAELEQARAHAEYAYILFTSGSTGEPKGVAITHRNLHAYVSNVTELVGGIDESDRIIQLADFTFDISVHDLFASWMNGAELYSIPENATLTATRFVQEHQLTGWFSVPSTAGLLNQVGMLGPESMPSLRFSLFCGEALTGAVAESWCCAAPESRIYNLYGPTEATVAFTAFEYHSGREKIPDIVSLGEPFPGQRVGLFDSETAVQVEDHETGEICLSGSQVSPGYWADPKLNNRRFFDAHGERWYRTGDLGRYDSVSGYQFAGRIDHQVKIRGYRVELQEIESTIRKLSKQDVVAVIPWPIDPHGGARGCVAFVAGGQVEAQSIIEGCSLNLPDYMVPQEVITLDEMPLNANGKVDYKALANHPLLGT